MAIRVGVAGLGRGRDFVWTFGNHRDCEVVAVCDTQPGLAGQVAEAMDVPMHFEDYSEFCKASLDAIIVATPAPVHVRNAVEALEHGKHVLSEVPAAWDLEECDILARAVEQSGLKYMLAENINYKGYVSAYRAIVGEGTIGMPTYAEAEYVHDCRRSMHGRYDGVTGDSATGPTWRARMPPIFYCTHSLGPLLEILDTRCVSACGLHTGSNLGAEWGAIDMEVGIFRTECGVVVKLFTGFCVAREPMLLFFVVYGTEGYLESPRGGVSERHSLYSERIPNLQGPMEMPLAETRTKAPPEAKGNSDYFMIDDFVRCILDDTKPAIDVYRGLDYSAPGLCAHMSAENGGEPVEVPDFRPK